MYNLKWLPLNRIKCPLHLGLILAPKRHLTKWDPLSRWRLSTLGSIIWVPPPQLKFNRSHKEWYICVGLLKWFITLAVCRVDKLPLEMFAERVKEIWRINRETGERDEQRERGTHWEREEKDIWQTLLKAFQKAFAVVNTFGSSLLHLKVTNAFHYTSKPSFFRDILPSLLSLTFSSPEALVECVFGLI